jgi:benzoyl-CoA reductase subunit B
MNEKVLENFIKLTHAKHMVSELLAQSPKRMDQFDSRYIAAMAESDERIIACMREGKPFLHSWYFNAPELYTAMDLDWYTCSFPAVFAVNVEGPSVFEETDKIPLDHDICTLQRLMLRSIEGDFAPVPTISVAGLTPCDGIGLFHEALKQYPGWRDIPVLEMDPPYWEDEAALRYYGTEIRRMAKGLEGLTGKALDLDRLKQVLEESNKQYDMWVEYNDARRMKPCPHPSFSGDKIFNIAQSIPSTVGHSSGTELIRALLDDEMEMVRNKKAGWKMKK